MQDKFCLFIAACLVQNINAGTVSKWHGNAGQQEPAGSRGLPRKWLIIAEFWRIEKERAQRQGPAA